ncbi:DNA-binding NarL/FixJ family response regulator [Cytobacillus horneckiae]|uniref:DNA-binding response regulator n=1 Tax=Cytobacillus horneckiae TaxID=549687 RepID=A0A2N0ZEJ7_9BACI|nr:response regulator transcription factor [Cytobacillus horneckiae]MBN6888115.1 response regulator transcription factor [Cytobacillus horneckiae]MEC1154669.1 response regulator transcription factor [Cytobacillus horneckiae]MED2939010.1 response regulator transcription factor [Cytobacillus horneckiae]PKG27913.1 DNA-binding response regulator [Cytobacillus horneckiae]
MEKINVIIVDDNSFIREGMKIILNSYNEFIVMGIFHNGKEAVEFCESNQVDVALLDVRMPVMNGVEATKLMTERTSAKPLILTTFDDDEYILEAIQNGAKGYLLKNNDPEQIRDAIRMVHKGQNVMQNAVLDKIKLNLLKKKAPYKIDRELFTEREISIMELVAKGLSNREISKQIFISEGTVANYISTILSKANLKHRTNIAIYYLTGKEE